MITPKNFTKHGRASFTAVNTKWTTEKASEKFLCVEGDLLLLLTDLTPTCELLGKPAVLSEDDAPCLLNQRIAKVEILNGEVEKRFLANLFLTTSFAQRIKETATGSTVRHSSNRIILGFAGSFPALPEQQKIADFLTAVDGRIGQLIQKKALLEDYKKGVMQQLFTQTIRFKDDNGNDFPDWEEKELGEVADVVGGGTPDSTNESYWNGDVQWFTPTEIRSKFASHSKRTVSQSGLKKCSASLLPVGAILFTSRATIAEVSIATEPCTTNQGFQSIIANSDTNNEFIYYWVIQFKKEFLRKAQGSTFLEIGGKEVRKMPMLIPSFSEQTKIADFLSAIDRKIESVATQITETQSFKRGLLQQMFV